MRAAWRRCHLALHGEGPHGSERRDLASARGAADLHRPDASYGLHAGTAMTLPDRATFGSGFTIGMAE